MHWIEMRKICTEIGCCYSSSAEISGGCFPFPPVRKFFHSLYQGHLSSTPYSLPFGSVPFPAVQPTLLKMQTNDMGERILLFALEGGAYRAGPLLALWKTLGTPPSIFYHFIIKIRGETGIYRLIHPSSSPFCLSLPLAQRMPQK